jgi:amidase
MPTAFRLSLLCISLGMAVLFLNVASPGGTTGKIAGGETMSNLSGTIWTEASIEDLQAQLEEGSVTSVALVDYFFARIEQYDVGGPTLNAIQHTNPQARAQAQALDEERRSQGPRSRLHGIPVLVKDNYETDEMPTTAGSKLFAGFHPRRDADLVRRLKEAGAIIIAKTTLHEFAYGITTVGSAFGATKNPYNLSRNPGGSSGGTGAAVAANFAVFGMGSDTCGSVRIPAAQNNLVGIRATQGRLSRTGIVPLSSTQDIGGPLARSVRDIAIALEVLEGEDPADAQTEGTPSNTNYVDALSEQQGAKIGVLTDWLRQDPADQPVAQVFEAALAKMGAEKGWQTQALGSPEVNDHLDRPYGAHGVLIYDFKVDIEKYLQANPALGFQSLTDMISRAEHHPVIEDSLLASVGIGDQYELYRQELAQRVLVRDGLERLMEDHGLDALAYPTIRQVAAPHGEEQMGTNCRLSANSGLPAISVPIGFDADGVPIGLELLGRAHSEQQLLNLSLTIENVLGARRLPASTP